MSAYFKNDKNYQTGRSKAPPPRVAAPLRPFQSKCETPSPVVPSGAVRPRNRPEPRVEYGRPGQISPSIVQKLLLNQKVEIHVEAHGWVVGIVVATLQFIDALSGWGYQVRYRMSETSPEIVAPIPAAATCIRTLFDDL